MLYRHSPKPQPIPAVVAAKIKARIATNDSIATQIKELESMWQTHPNHAPIALQLGNLYAAQQNHAEAIKYFRTYVQLDTASDAWEIRLDIAKEFFLSRNVDSSYSELLAMEKDHADHPGVLYNLGALAANGGDSASAKQYWNRLLKVAPQSMEADNARSGLARLGGK